jgi:hypothetical protein
MRFTTSSWLKTLGLLGLATAGTALHAQAQSLAQSFENSPADTWNFVATPATYNVPADNDQWAILPSIGTGALITTPSAGAGLWGGRDLDGPATGGVSLWHYLDFAPVAIQTGSAAATEISFKYYTNAFDGSDSLAYVVQFDNGTTWPAPRTYTQLNKDTQAWTTVTVPVPAGSTHARLRLAVRQNGNEDWVAFDEISLSRNAAPVVPDLGFTGSTLVVPEQAGTVSLPLSIRNANATASTVEVVVAPLGTATAGIDYTFASTQTVTFAPGATTATLTLPLADDAAAEAAEYFTVRLQNPTNATLTTGSTECLVFIKDNDTPVPSRDRNLRLNLLGSYQNGASGTNSAEIVAHDPSTDRLYVANSIGGKLDILNFATPGMLTPVASVSMAPYGGINSVVVRNGLVACAVEDGTSLQSPGKVVFFDQNGTFLKQVSVGSLPDMITFSPDGRYVLTANEGEPSADYTNDPNGSVSLIDLSAINGNIANLTQANVTTLDFVAWNGQEAALRTAGIRIFGGAVGGPRSSVAQDLEPEYITVSPDSRTAYVALQENNALATIDLTRRTISSLRSVGYQDHTQPGFSFDASDQGTEVLLANWPVRGMRMPDAIAGFELPAALGGGRYIVTANEGDAREYTAFSEVTRLGSAGYVLDSAAFPQAALLKNNAALGRLNVTTATGDTDGDGDIDEIHAFGGRSFSILDASTGATVYDSGDLLERLTSADAGFGAIFNASNTTGAPAFKNRSDDKGPEPEGITIGSIRDTTYAFVSLERIGGVAVFNVNNPAQPRLVDYLNNRSLTAGTGDLGPEGTVFIAAANSPTGQPLVILANEVSSTVTVYEVQLRGTVVTSTADAHRARPLHLYPNPAPEGGPVRLSRAVSGQLLDMLGRPVRQLRAATQLETAGLTAGVYVLRGEDGSTARLVVK